LPFRVIPRLDIKGPNLVKGFHLEGLRVLGKPEQFARHYAENGADELLYMDVVASLYGRNSLVDIVERTAREIFIPLTVGGGLRTIDDVSTVLRAGADKVALNTAAIGNPGLVREAARRFGTSTIVIAIEAKHKTNGTYEAYTDNGRQPTGVDAIEWALRAVELGAGEILLTSIEREGTGRGFDLHLIRKIAEMVPVPVIAHGGAGNVNHIMAAIQQGQADAVAVASILHYGFIRNQPIEGDYSGEGNTEYLRSRRSFKSVQPLALTEIKAQLAVAGIDGRPAFVTHNDV